MHAISSCRGNRPTNTALHKATNPQTIHCAAKLSAQCSYRSTTAEQVCIRDSIWEKKNWSYQSSAWYNCNTQIQLKNIHSSTELNPRPNFNAFWRVLWRTHPTVYSPYLRTHTVDVVIWLLRAIIIREKYGRITVFLTDNDCSSFLLTRDARNSAVFASPDVWQSVGLSLTFVYCIVMVKRYHHTFSRPISRLFYFKPIPRYTIPAQRGR